MVLSAEKREDPRAVIGGKGKKNPPSLMEDPRFAPLASGRTHELS